MRSLNPLAEKDTRNNNPSVRKIASALKTFTSLLSLLKSVCVCVGQVIFTTQITAEAIHLHNQMVWSVTVRFIHEKGV